MDSRKRLAVQSLAALLQNAHFRGFFTGKIYQGPLKQVCVPGLNCYSCPGAVGACPIGSLQSFLNGRRFRFPYYDYKDWYGEPGTAQLLEGVKGGGEGLHWLEPLVLREADGSFTEEWHRIYDHAPSDKDM